MNESLPYQTLLWGTLLLLPGIVIFSVLFRELNNKKKLQQINQALKISPISREKKLSKVQYTNLNPRMILYPIIISLTLVLFFLHTPMYLIIILVTTVFFLLRYIFHSLSIYYLNKLTNSLPLAIEFINRSIVSGNSINNAINEVAHANFPASQLFIPIYEALAVGNPFAETLLKESLKINHPEFSLCMAILIAQQETGKHDTTSLNHLSSLLRDKIALKRKIKTISAEAKFSGYIIALFPLICFIGINLMKPGYFDNVYASQIGRLLLVVALCSNIIGLLIMNKMTQIHI